MAIIPKYLQILHRERMTVAIIPKYLDIESKTCSLKIGKKNLVK